MPSDVFPLRAIVFQFLFLLVAIAIESLILQWRLQIDRKTSVQYATTVNLLATVIGWIVYFNSLPLLSPPLKMQLVGYIFFDNFLSSLWAGNTASMLILVGFTMFFLTFIIKVQGLILLEFLLEKRQVFQSDKPTLSGWKRREQRPGFVRSIPNEAGAMLFANAASFSAILLLLILRILEQSIYR